MCYHIGNLKKGRQFEVDFCVRGHTFYELSNRARKRKKVIEVTFNSPKYIIRGGFIMKQTEWKIIYTSYEGVAKRAINLLSKEVGKYIIRENGVYRIYVLPCEKEGGNISKNAFLVSCYKESKIIQKYVEPNEVPAEGFLVKVIPNPNNTEGRIVILTAHTEQELYYSVVSFLDDYIPNCELHGSSNLMPDLIFDKILPEYSYAETPDFKTRSIFTWGHSINDYRSYIDNMARTKFNELIIWNDYIPLNISEIIDYAHSYSIKVVLGYTWGWDTADVGVDVTEESLGKIKEQAISRYCEEYIKTNCDGIYFQTFTERQEERIGGKLIAEVVTEMVNEIAEKLWEITPNLRLLFGLHATSVKNRLDFISKVNPRIELYWEDCGDFPYNYNTNIKSNEEYEETMNFTKKLLELRGGKGVVLVFKGVMMLDWTKFVHQSGPFVMGENAPLIAAHDKAIRANSRREYSAEWVKNGEYAHRMIRYIKENKIGDVTMCLAGTFDGGIYFPTAVYAQMFRNTEDDYSEVMRKVARRSCITVD